MDKVVLATCFHRYSSNIFSFLWMLWQLLLPTSHNSAYDCTNVINFSSSMAIHSLIIRIDRAPYCLVSVQNVCTSQFQKTRFGCNAHVTHNEYRPSQSDHAPTTSSRPVITRHSPFFAGKNSGSRTFFPAFTQG